jgi:hypothetical protein
VSADLGAVANYGSNTVTRLVRHEDWISVGEQINLALGCVKPDSVALTRGHLFVGGATCAESHAWPSGAVDGSVVHIAVFAIDAHGGLTLAATSDPVGVAAFNGVAISE